MILSECDHELAELNKIVPIYTQSDLNVMNFKTGKIRIYTIYYVIMEQYVNIYSKHLVFYN